MGRDGSREWECGGGRVGGQGWGSGVWEPGEDWKCCRLLQFIYFFFRESERKRRILETWCVAWLFGTWVRRETGWEYRDGSGKVRSFSPNTPHLPPPPLRQNSLA